MEDLSRSEYPAMLASLQPSQAVNALTERVKRINRVNDEIADWLQERRKVEELYVAGLRKLLLFKVPNSQSELGVFQAPWDKILQTTDSIAASHHLYAQRIEKDVELALRGFQHKKEMQNMQTIASNLLLMARELDEAQEKSDKLSKKGGKANAQKVDAASTKLESATQQWESQSPFIFETLQALDEQRVNHLRDVLTQLQTHEVDQASRTQASAEEALNTMLEINTSLEVQNFAQKTVAGRPKLERRTGTASQPATRQSSVVASSNLAPPSAPPAHEDNVSDHSARNEKTESRLRSRIGTMLGRRRQSIHGGFGQLSPQKSIGPFSRNIASSHGRSISPRNSSHNLSDTNNRLSSLAEAESPTSARQPESPDARAKASHENTNGVGPGDASNDTPATKSTSNILNGTAEDIFDAPPPPGPPPSHSKPQSPLKDADGFTIPAAKNDPISEAQRAAAEETDQLFNVKIQNQPVAEEDPDAKQAAMSNVANTLTQMGMPSRKTGTVRGRRDVRNTIYVPSSLPVPESASTNPFPPSPPLPSSASRPMAVAALASEASIAGTSDTQSVRSGTSLSSLAHLKHPEMGGSGLNSSIIETVSAIFDDGVIKSAKINGEIAFSYNHDDSSQSSQEKIRINNFPNLEVIGPNRIFVSAVSPERPDEFTLDTTHLNKTSAAFNYRVHSDDASATLADQCPLIVKPAWKPSGDKLGLLLQYRINPNSKLPRPVTLSNVVFVATYEGARASGAQTKPSGTHLKDKHLVYWRLGEVTLSGDDWTKIVCRIIGAENGEPQPGHIEARWEYAVPRSAEREAGGGISVSRFVENKGKGKEKDVEEADDPFADDSGPLSPSSSAGTAGGSWVDVPLVRRLVAGKYDAK